MASDIIQIEATLRDSISEALEKIAGNLKNVETSAKDAGEKAAASLGKVKDSADESSGGVKGFLSNVLSIAGGVGAVNLAQDAFDFLKDSVQRSLEASKAAEQTQASLAASLKATGSITGVTSDMATKLSESLSNVTTYSADTILSGESMLATFDKIGKNTFPQATNMSLDLAAKLGISVPNAARLLGRALEDPAKGLTQLTRYGVTLSSTQTDQIKQFMAVNNVAGAQNVILGALHSRFGDVAQAIGNTFTGKLEILNNHWELMREKIGDAVLPILTNLMSAIMPLAAWLSENLPQAVQTVADAFSRNFGPVLAQVAATVQTLGQQAENVLVPAFEAIWQAGNSVVNFLRSASPAADAVRAVLVVLAGVLLAVAVNAGITAVATKVALIPSIIASTGAWIANAAAVVAATWPILAIGAAVAGIVLLFKHWWDTNEGFRQALETLANGAMTLFHNALNVVMPIIEGVITYIQQLAQVLEQRLAPVFTVVTQVVATAMPYVQKTITTTLQIIGVLWQGAWGFISNYLGIVFDGIKLVIGTAFNVIKLLFSVALDIIKGNWSGVWSDIRGFVTNELSLIQSVIGDVLSHIQGIISAIWGVITGLTNIAWSNIKNSIAAVWQAIQFVITTDINAVKLVLSTVWNAISNTTANIWNGISSFIGNTIHTIWSNIQNMAGAIKNAILAPFQDAASAIGGIMKNFANAGLNMLNGDLRSFAAFVNDFGGAINWVAGKLGHSNLIPHFNAPQVALLATGTDSFAGGMAIVGEEGPELVTLPKGSKVMPANQTRATMLALHGAIPAFAGGIGNPLGDIVGAVSNAIGDVSGWISKGPAALLNAALSAAGIHASLPGSLQGLADGAFATVKSWATSELQTLINAVQSVMGVGVGGTAAGVLHGFPLMNQLALSDINRDFDCVPTSLAAAASYLLGHIISPVQLKDAVYGAGYMGGTSPERYASYLRSLGVGEGYVSGGSGSLISDVHGYISRGIPVIAQIPSAWNSNTGTSTHAIAFAGQVPGGLVAMNPWNGFWQTASDPWWMARLRYGNVNPMTKMASGGIIREPVVGVGLHSGGQYVLGERGPEAVIPTHLGAQQPGGATVQEITKYEVYLDGQRLTDYMGHMIVSKFRTVSQRKM